MNQKPVHVFAKWQVKQGQLETVLQILGEVVRKSEAEKGNLFYQVHQSNTDAHTILLFEGYTDEAALAAHRESTHFQDLVVGQIVPLLEAREVIVATPLTLA